ncbi:hypothetical protein N9204_00375 [bacterium]|nr:hypothetical protein [bacterium]
MTSGPFTGPIGSHNSGSRTWTNSTHQNVQLDTDPDTLATYAATSSYTNVYSWVTTNGASVATNEVESVAVRVTSSTQLAMNVEVQDVWNIDLYGAMLEREFIEDPRAGWDDSEKPSLYDEGERREFLRQWKQWVFGFIGEGAIDTNELVSGSFDTYFASNDEDYFPLYDGVSDFCTAHSIPSNYFTQTPYSNLGGWGDSPELRVQTNSFVTYLWGDEATTNTYLSTDACGDNSYRWELITTADTNGTVTAATLDFMDVSFSVIDSYSVTNATWITNTVTCTNDWIAAGFTSHDYGYKHAQDIMEAFTLYQKVAYLSGTNNPDQSLVGAAIINTNTTSVVSISGDWSAAWSSRATNSPGSIAGLGAYAGWEEISTNNFKGRLHRGANYVRYDLPTTNYAATVTEYYRGEKLAPFGYAASTYEVESIATGIIEGQFSEFNSVADYEPTNSVYILDHFATDAAPFGGTATLSPKSWAVDRGLLLLDYSESFQFVK